MKLPLLMLSCMVASVPLLAGEPAGDARAATQLRAAGAKAASDYLWVANSTNHNIGTVSKVDSRRNAGPPFYREVGRYVSVTCQSDPVKGTNAGVVLGITSVGTCDGNSGTGCCARDDTSGGAKQPVNLLQNRPSRTAVDHRGDAWVANTADDGVRQSSVSKIANAPSDCVERNGIGGIQTSADLNGDGIITTDCDSDGLPDSGSVVCAPGQVREFWGLSDECVLFTVNTGPVGQWGRALALGPGQTSAAPADAWAGTYLDGRFYRIDGSTGEVLTSVVLASAAGVDPRPNGAVIDQFGILWAPNLATEGNCVGGGCVFYFDTAAPADREMVKSTLSGGGFFGIALDGHAVGADLIQQIWFSEFGASGYGAYRYRPVRNAGFAGLKSGKWAKGHVTGPGQLTQGRGVAVDNRSPARVWIALDMGGMAHVPAAIPDDVTSTFPTGSNLVQTGVQHLTVGTGVAPDLDIWAVNEESSTLMHFDVDAGGTVLNAGVPDVVPLDDRPGVSAGKPRPSSFSDFTGFGFRNFTAPLGDAMFSDGFESQG